MASHYQPRRPAGPPTHLVQITRSLLLSTRWPSSAKNSPARRSTSPNAEARLGLGVSPRRARDGEEELTESGRCPSRSEWQAGSSAQGGGGLVVGLGRRRLRSAGCYCYRSWTLVELMGSANLILRNFITCRTLLERSQDLFFFPYRRPRPRLRVLISLSCHRVMVHRTWPAGQRARRGDGTLMFPVGLSRWSRWW